MSSSEALPELMLSLETSGDDCSLAILRGDCCLVEHIFRHEMHLSERLFDHIENALREAGATLQQIEAFAVGVGPGSFTGTRIGVMTIKTLAEVTARPVYGIEGLEALAYEYAGMADTVVVPMLPCRSGVVYVGAYTVATGRPEPLLPADALPISELAAQLIEQGSAHLCFCGAAVQRYKDELQTLFESEPSVKLSFGKSLFPRSSLVGLLARIRRDCGDLGDDLLGLAPHYVSPPPITLSHKGNSPPNIETEARPLEP